MAQPDATIERQQLLQRCSSTRYREGTHKIELDWEAVDGQVEVAHFGKCAKLEKRLAVGA